MATAFLPSILADASFLSSIFVPVIGWVVPIATFSFLFLYIEGEDVA
ncbi:photosystem I reaction center subunit VIII [Trichormus variabilis ARAD]|uniref:Photosystem I reaction center subunit VIII n=2 Tax=Anabaena variabilis TaxID=264691 RepID=PSAI_TRIV2|nr:MULTISPECIES: photosystem I reaction center subunit VIII [Nostocaceae]P23079.2 RecName: Full=Photosystem I reaction center subunit VIII; Flags: Precursor [Trichormus variabilis ATCC 29413]MBC1213341.1 photosystem I reaction center subunit VIII [Trichormus variabilis ARAD]MBC1254702.1 photosystem I reaction center subunit VIII [Trichormus variabilis V5]MBC1268232.1 photosystem I reaction center subunit VIII [Trichormus variabilis FSR]MBC1301142.1 photosystem I reaction center subunit VIII [T